MTEPAGYTPATPPPPPPGTTPMRPGSVTAAGVLLIILGAFAAIGGVLFLVGGAFLAGGDVGEQFEEQFGSGFGDVFEAAAGVLIVVAILVIAYAIFKIIAGAKVLGLRNGWRITGIVLSAVAMLGWVIVLIGSFQGSEQVGVDPTTLELTTVSAGPNIGGIIFSLVFLAANTITLILLARAGSAFPRR